MSTLAELKGVLSNQQIMQYEEEITRNPYYLKSWLKYLDFRNNSAPVNDRYVIYERALKFLPRSYKLWFAYLTLRRNQLDYASITDKRFKILVNTFERALIHMHKMPVIWSMYLSLVTKMQLGTSARKAFDRALQSLPITQHEPVWELYITWTRGFGVPETTVRVYRRYLMFDPSHREDLVSYLESIGQYQEAANQLAICVNDDNYVAPSGCTRHQMWMRLCDLCASHPDEISSTLKVDAIIRSGIARFSDEVGRLWTRLADYYIRLGMFENARDIYEEALQAVVTVRDFTIVFDAYVKFEESVLMAKMREAEEGDATDAINEEVELRLGRLEHLTDKRPLLLNSVVLRQNPHNVYEWHKRIKLFKGDTTRTLMTYMEAVKTVDPKNAHGRLSSLWLSMSRFYESHADLENARAVLRKGSEVEYRNIEELSAIWCSWGEMELKHEQYDKALAVMQEATTEPLSSIKRRKARAAAMGKASMSSKQEDGEADSSTCLADRLHRNVKVWGFYLDLEESLGTLETCRSAYDRAMEIKVVTPQMVLNYASFLEEKNLFEDSFRVYERAVSLFSFPHVKPIWLGYIDKFMARYGGTKLERLRDLFEQAVKTVPATDAAEFYIKYGKAEESFGLARHAMSVYDRATRAVPEDSRADMYRLYIRKVEEHYGVTKTRAVYERAITELSDDHSRDLCIEFADMESRLGEVDRARAIFQHGSQFADPRKYGAYWEKWKDFEEAHGNVDTFKDMRRVQRSVEAAYSQVNYLARDTLAAASMKDGQSEVAAGIGEGVEGIARQAEIMAMQRAAAVDEQSNKRKFVAASTSAAPPAKVPALESSSREGLGSRASADEINIDDIEGESEDMGIKVKPLPQAIFGNVSVTAGQGEPKKQMGALDRFAQSAN